VLSHSVAGMGLAEHSKKDWAGQTLRQAEPYDSNTVLLSGKKGIAATEGDWVVSTDS